MNNKLKKTVICLGLGTFALGLTTSLSSFGSIADSTSTPTYECYIPQTVACTPSTNFSLTINGTSTNNYTVTSGGSTPGQWTVTAAGQTLTFPMIPGNSSSSETGTNGLSYTFSQTVTSNTQIYCNLTTSPTASACARYDCQHVKLQTYTCSVVGGGTGTGTPNSAKASASW